MRLAVEILTGGFFYVEVENDATVGDLKKEIGTQRQLPHDRLILTLDDDANYGIHGPVMIRDEDVGVSLMDLGVRDGSHFYLFFNTLNSTAELEDDGEEEEGNKEDESFSGAGHSVVSLPLPPPDSGSNQPSIKSAVAVQSREDSSNSEADETIANGNNSKLPVVQK